jgi:hypothetical protein
MEYKGYVIFKYENEKRGIRWGVETKDGKELIFDQTRKYLCERYIDSLTANKAP